VVKNGKVVMAMKTWFITGTSRGFGREWALEGLSQSLAAEVAGFGSKVTLIEPTGYATDWAGSSARHATPLPAYEPVREQAVQARARRFTPGDPGATRDAVLQLVDGPNPPLRLFLGEARRWASRPRTTSPSWPPGANGSRWAVACSIHSAYWAASARDARRALAGSPSPAIVAASRNLASWASGGSEWLLATMTVARLMRNC
jgi:hypothetical protein